VVVFIVEVDADVDGITVGNVLVPCVGSGVVGDELPEESYINYKTIIK